MSVGSNSPDPVGRLARASGRPADRAEWLTSFGLDALRFEGPGTDLTIGLIPGVRWERAEMNTPGGLRFVPNLPTEEVYTTPDPLRVEGRVRLTRPVILGGREIADVVLRFESRAA